MHVPILSVLGNCRTRKLAINDSIDNLLTRAPCSISSAGGCEWWRMGELLHLVALSVLRAAIGSSDGQGG